MVKAMLIVGRVYRQRLIWISKELKRQRFDCGAKTPPGDRLLLALEDVKQTGGAAVEAEDKSPAERATTAKY